MTPAAHANALKHAFLHVYHQDKANAAMHCATVRYSPITFRLAECIQAISPDEHYQDDGEFNGAVMKVLNDRGSYEEDKGR